MPDLIKLLPDSVANQIAAGEVIQRPASAVKELLENAVDAGSTQVRLIVKDAGKTLIQVIDNGTGMSETDARMCFERHATSKIREASDLFSIRTLGFRGEALASIAAIAQVELKSRKTSEDIGTCIIIEGSKVKSQEPVACAQGTSFVIKNLFYNVPARRNFLKSDQVEFRHILEEFQRVALVNPDIEFILLNNDKPVFQLSKGNLKLRIVQIFGNQMNEKLIPVELNTEMVSIHGYIGKPESARKTRGEQYFFANNRYIRHPYLHHAVEQAFDELLPDSSIPTYFIYIQVDPDTIDINIHPTKTEVNFQHGQLLYASMRTAVKHSLGMFSISPTIDFDTEPTFDYVAPKGYEPKQPQIQVNPDYNPFKSTQSYLKPNPAITPNKQGWEKLYDGLLPEDKQIEQIAHPNDIQTNRLFAESVSQKNDEKEETENIGTGKLLQVQNRYIVANLKSGMLVVDISKAHQRIVFEKMLNDVSSNAITKQKVLFPQIINLSPVDSSILQELNQDLSDLGFEISDLGNGSFAVIALPFSMNYANTESFIECLLEDYKKAKVDTTTEKNMKLIRIIAGNLTMKPGKILKTEEMQSIIDELFACTIPDLAPDGSKIMKIIPISEIERLIR